MTPAIYRGASLVFDVLEAVEHAERRRLLELVDEEAWRLAIKWAGLDELAGNDGDSLPAREAWHQAVAAARIRDLVAGAGHSSQSCPEPARSPLAVVPNPARNGVVSRSPKHVGNNIECGAAAFHKLSFNRKLSPVDLVDVGGDRPRPKANGPYCASTYVSIAATCSDDCPFKGAGCYVQLGFTGASVKRLDERARGLTGLDVARDEAAAIDFAFRNGVPQDGARGGRDLRLHDSGDAASPAAADMLGAAAARWRARGGGAVWTYTHAWRSIDRAAWGSAVQVLASVEKPEDIPAARAMGYAPAIVVEEHKSPRAYDVQGTRIIPCPAETSDTTCVECRLCLDRDLFSMNAGIAFAVHGPGRSRADGSRSPPPALTALRIATGAAR